MRACIQVQACAGMHACTCGSCVVDARGVRGCTGACHATRMHACRQISFKSAHKPNMNPTHTNARRSGPRSSPGTTPCTGCSHGDAPRTRHVVKQQTGSRAVSSPPPMSRLSALSHLSLSLSLSAAGCIHNTMHPQIAPASDTFLKHDVTRHHPTLSPEPTTSLTSLSISLSRQQLHTQHNASTACASF